MEVHTHTHTPRKKWAHYFWEFLMLFLAVTAGFFVENLREHYIEHKREKAFVRSMISDLQTDIKQLDSLNERRRIKQEMIDSILWILDAPDPDQYGNELYYLVRWLPRPLRIITNDGTMQQLKNAGNLRLIRSRKAVDAMMEYDQMVRFWAAVEDREESLIQQMYPSLKKIFDARVFEKMVKGMRIDRPEGSAKLLIRDKSSLDEFYSHVHFLKNVNSYTKQYGDQRRQLAERVLSVLDEEYHLSADRRTSLEK